MEKKFIYTALLLLKHASMCLEHQNHLEMTFFFIIFGRKLQKLWKNSFPKENYTKTQEVQLIPPNMEEFANLSDRQKFSNLTVQLTIV